jgi:hypothetical protein
MQPEKGRDRMIKKLSAIGLLMLLMLISGAPAAAGVPDDDDILYKFLLYTGNTYLSRTLKNLDKDDYSLTMAGKLFSARVLGYSLGNLLQYARRGSENHKTWLVLEQKTKEAMFILIDRQGAREGWDPALIEKRRQNALAQFMGAQQGWYDALLVAQTGVTGKDAPNFFETLTAVPPSPPPVQPPVQPVQPPAPPPINPPVPQPVNPPVPPAPSSDDAVAGVYKVIGKSWENDPDCGSEVTLVGSLNEVEAEFKLWDRTGVTWHYKGPAKWDGQTLGNIRALKGKTQWLKYPHIIYGLDIRVTRGADGVWRASSINIGGNLFQLAENRDVGRPVANTAKTLTIRNSTAGRITVYLDGVEIGLENRLGTVEPRSETKFVGIPERGRWYLKIDPAPDTYPKRHVSVLIVKEAESAFFHEVLEWHLK